MAFQSFTPISGLRRLTPSALAVPLGTSVEPQVAELLRDIAFQLHLPEAGVFTPWATRQSDLTWQEIVNPDTNIATFEITDAKIQEASVVLFGQPIPFVTVLTSSPLVIAEIERLVEDSNYDLFETQAVYSQLDSDPIPRIQFLHWFRVKDIADQSQRGARRMEQVARDMGGVLRFSQQVPVQGSTVRQPPGISFEEAFDLQGGPVDVLPPIPGNPGSPPILSPGPSPVLPGPITPGPSPAPAQPQSNYVVPVLVGIGVLAAIIVVSKAVKR